MIKKDIFNKDVKAQLKASAKDKIYRFIMADGMLKGAVVHATRMVTEMRANHQTGPLETLILGQAYVAASLICSGLKGKNDRISMVIECSGPIKGLDVEAERVLGTPYSCGRARSHNQAGENPAPEGWPATG